MDFPGDTAEETSHFRSLTGDAGRKGQGLEAGFFEFFHGDAAKVTVPQEDAIKDFPFVRPFPSRAGKGLKNGAGDFFPEFIPVEDLLPAFPSNPGNGRPRGYQRRIVEPGLPLNPRLLCPGPGDKRGQ